MKKIILYIGLFIQLVFTVLTISCTTEKIIYVEKEEEKMSVLKLVALSNPELFTIPSQSSGAWYSELTAFTFRSDSPYIDGVYKGVTDGYGQTVTDFSSKKNLVIKSVTNLIAGLPEIKKVPYNDKFRNKIKIRIANSADYSELASTVIYLDFNDFNYKTDVNFLYTPNNLPFDRYVLIAEGIDIWYEGRNIQSVYNDITIKNIITLEIETNEY